MTGLILVRHGQTEWNALRKYQGKTDIPLNDNGRRQAALVAEQLQSVDITAVYSSELSRACETARLIAEPHGIAVITDPRLNEIDQGEWEGLRREEIAERFGARLRLWEQDPHSTCPPGGESLAAVRNRAVDFIQEMRLRHAEGAVCVVAHKVTNAIIKSEILGLSIVDLMRQEPPNGGWEQVQLFPPFPHAG